MTTKFNVDSQFSGVNGFGLPFCDIIFTAELAANSEKTFTVPGSTAAGMPTPTTYNRFIAVFSYQLTKDFWVALNQTADDPASGDFALATSELTPPAKIVKSGDVVHVYSDSGGMISVALYAYL